MPTEEQIIVWLLSASFVMPIVLAGVLIWFIINYQKRKTQFELDAKNHQLAQQQAIIDRQKAIENERTRIASEMHDDLGAGLTTIRYLSESAIKKIENDKIKTQIEKISKYSHDLVSNLSDIIWTMNSRFDDVSNLAGHMRSYAADYLLSREIKSSFRIDDSCDKQEISGQKRRDIFLVFKELLHNAAKYSQAEEIIMEISCEQHLMITIFEKKGIGFDPDLSIEKGNGLFNIRKRINNLKGNIAFYKNVDGMLTEITCPLENLLYEN